MFKFGISLIAALSLILSVSCTSTPKKDEEVVAVGDVNSDPNISSEAMSFDPSGSDSGNIQGLNTINFDYDQAALTSSARQTLADNAQWIKDNKNVTIQIEGHCDSRGSVEYNLALGERRAKSVKDYLASLGVSPKRMTIISYGKEKPLEIGDTEAVYARNRRANFVPLSN